MQTDRGQISGSGIYEKKRQYGGIACKNEFEEKMEKMSTDSDPFIVSSITDSNKQETGRKYRLGWQNMTKCQ